MLVFDCSSCGARLQMPEELAGKQVRCATCQGIITAPADPSAAISAEPVPASAPAATGVTGPENVRTPRQAAREDDDRDDDLRRGTRRDGSTAVAASAGIGAGVIIAIVLGVGGCLVIPCLIALLVPAVQKVREAAARVQATNDLKQISLGIHGHHDTFKTMPPPKVALMENGQMKTVELSWRVSILPFIEQQAVFKQFDTMVAWDNPRNVGAANNTIPIYLDVRLNQGPMDNTTCYHYFTGPGTLWPDNGPRRFMDMTDGTSNVFMVSEGANRVPWAKPADIAVQPGQPLALPPNMFLVAMADASVRSVDRSRATDATIRVFLEYKSGNPRPPLD